MSGWSIFTKAEGFLDRVLDDREKLAQRKTGQSITGSRSSHVEPLDRANTPTSRWQDRLTRAASQFTSTESLPSQSRSFVAGGITVSPDAAQSGNVTANERTSWQQSPIFPPNMPSRLADIPSDMTVSLLGNSDPRISTSSSDPRISLQSVRSPAISGLPSEGSSVEVASGFTSLEPDITETGLADLVSKLQHDLNECESRRLEEAQSHSERISTLEARLAFLSKERVSESLQITQSTASTQEQKSLAERDQRIALLLEEGDKMSKKELQYMSNIKRLRARITELEALITSSLKAVEKADHDSSSLKRDHKNLQEVAKRNEAKIRELSKFETEVAELKNEKHLQTKLNNDLKRQLADADETISQNVTIWTQLQAEKSKSDKLQKRIGDLLLEAKATADENASDMSELQGKFDRITERNRVENEDKAREIARLEAELEIMRANVEESTSSTSENAQTKLLRQIENLQTQQSLARQNWARIEESLILRSSHAEKEGDELRAQEEDLRKRLRASVIQRKELEEEHSGALSKVRTLENDAKDMREELELMGKKLQTLQDNFELEREGWVNEKEILTGSIERQVQDRLEEERRLYTPDHTRLQHLDVAPRNGFPFQRHVMDSPNTSNTPSKRPSVSRVSTQASRMPSRRNASQSQYSILDDLRSPPLTNHDEDPFSSHEGSSQVKAPTERSLSTISAGASVGVLERLSANVRKMEMESVLLREDLSRMTRQRNEAREECVSFEKQLQDYADFQKKLEDERLAREQVQKKFETTLELLGEQTEENDQLKEDIMDMKKAFATSLQELSGHGAD